MVIRTLANNKAGKEHREGMIQEGHIKKEIQWPEWSKEVRNEQCEREHYGQKSEEMQRPQGRICQVTEYARLDVNVRGISIQV